MSSPAVILSRGAPCWWLLVALALVVKPAHAERIKNPTEPVEAATPVVESSAPPAADDAVPATAREPEPTPMDVPASQEELIPATLSSTAVAGVPLEDGTEWVLGPDDKASIPENSAAAAAFKRLRPAEHLAANSEIDKRLTRILAQERRGDLAGALHTATLALTAAPDRRQLRQITAQLQIALGRPTDVLQTLAPLVDINDSHWTPFFWAGVAELMQGHFARARNYLERATQLDSDRVEPWIARAIVEQETGNYAAALQLLEVARQRSPADTRLLLNLGYTYEKLGHTAAAIQNYKASLAGIPADRSAAKDRQLISERILKLSDSPAISAVN